MYHPVQSLIETSDHNYVKIVIKGYNFWSFSDAITMLN